MMVRVYALIVLLSAPIVLTTEQTRDNADGRRGSVKVQLLAINDFHGNLEPPSGTGALIGSTESGGAEYLATHLKNAVSQNPNSIIVAAGDLIGASPLLSGLFHDEPTIESMNAMNLAVSSVGNHEFDEGWQELVRMQKGECHRTDGCQDGDGFSGARFQYLSANVLQHRPPRPAPLLPATTIRTIAGVKIGFIGETTRGTPQLVTSSGVQGLTFLDEASTANAYASRLQRQGVNAIVLLIHEGGRQSTENGVLDPNGCENFSGPIDDIARKLSASIKVIISGHTHRFYNCNIGGHLVTSAASLGRLFTRVTLTIDRSKGTITDASATNEVVTRDVAKDPEQTRIIQKYDAVSGPISARIVGSITSNIRRGLNRAGESALGDVIADAQLAAASSKDRGGAIVAFMNIGGIRSELVGTESGSGGSPRQVTYGELFAVQPFGNVVTVLTMTGEDIKRVLEQQFDNPVPGQHEILQVSQGFTYRYALNAQPGDRVDPASIKIGGRLIGPTDRVRVTANNFLVAGGDGFTAFAEGRGKVGGVPDIDALAEYFKAHSPVRPGPQDRIVRTD
jgi:5'-nucleotidase